MWPFRMQTIFRNRWWTLAFVAFVCWQAAEWTPADNGGNNATDAAAAVALNSAGL